MKVLRKFLRLPVGERRLLAKAVLLLALIKPGLVLLPFRTVQRLLKGAVAAPIGVRDQATAEQVVWAVEKAGRRMPRFTTCLTQALAVQFLLSRRGYPALLRIGVSKDKEGEFMAHAWIESKGEVLIGGEELERYTPLTTLDGRRT